MTRQEIALAMELRTCNCTMGNIAKGLGVSAGYLGQQLARAEREGASVFMAARE
ncbi:hypothetical protein [uncultured Paraglaciecola sp.]|uniref:hypothetical protein n=1 Tax=uncultured Paraglaciecola sp. TaxID=1765024 RepID=UPI00260C86A6|nr:hypothetical protein [uncultured Paraglaciecola sp.]